MIHIPDTKVVRQQSIDWARRLLQQEFYILDSETTGLDEHGEIVQIAVINHHGLTIADTFVKPSVDINEKGRAYEVSGISNRMVRDAPRFGEVWDIIYPTVRNQQIVAYNATYDLRMVKQSCVKNGPSKHYPFDEKAWIDAMIPYSEFVGDWNDYYGNFRWQRLPGTQHGALSDCIAVLDLLNMMAKSE